MALLKLIYVGDDLYMRSNTSLSCIYAEDGRRFDWGFVGIVLANGDEVSIRQATEAERAIIIGRFVDAGGTLKPAATEGGD